MTQRILDLRTKPKPPYIYVGRAMFLQAEGKRLPASELANPLRIKDRNDAEEVRANLLQYKRDLWEKIKARDPRIMALLEEIGEDTALACWCCEKEGELIYSDPEICHAQLIFKAARWVRSGAGVEVAKCPQ